MFLLRRDSPRFACSVPDGTPAAGEQHVLGKGKEMMKISSWNRRRASPRSCCRSLRRQIPRRRQNVDVTGGTTSSRRRRPDIHGTASLVRNDGGISMTFRTTGLPAGEPVTIWWIILDPGSGNVVSGPIRGRARGRKPTRRSQLRRPSRGGRYVGVLPTRSSRARVHQRAGQTVILLARVHGPKDPGRIPVQIHTAENPKALLTSASSSAARWRASTRRRRSLAPSRDA